MKDNVNYVQEAYFSMIKPLNLIAFDFSHLVESNEIKMLKYSVKNVLIF